jgi:hypothetical protein
MNVLQADDLASQHIPDPEIRSCPSCGAASLQKFYEVDNIPAHSCLLMDSREEALAYPRGRLNLAFCSACCFISNIS